MKILHTSDWHLGAYVGPQNDNPMERMANTMKCLDVLVETAEKEQPDIIVISGDIFHNSRIWNDRAMAEVRTAIFYLEILGKIAPVMVLFGTSNHDASSSFSMMEDYFLRLKYTYVRFFTKPELIKVDTKSGPIQIAGLPGFDKGHFRAQFPGLSAEEENQVFTQQLSQIVQGLSAQVDPAIPSVLMAHHTVVGCDMGTGTHIFQANEVVLDAATLDNSAFDLVCLGHIHEAQSVKACNKPVFYAGSIDAFTFNDEGHPHGFWVHSKSNQTLLDEFIQTPAREFLTGRFGREKIENCIKGNGWFEAADNKVVRVLYTCDSETEKALDKKKLERDLYAAGAYYVSEIRPEKITAAVNQDRMTEKLTVRDCLERYLKEKYGNFTKQEIVDISWLADSIIEIVEASQPMGTTSGLFLPVEIEVRNYRSYAEEKLSFEDIFFAMVNGKNGSGKSSLFMDAITDCLYEETREKELTGWIRNGEKSGSISFTFSLGGDVWRVTRTRQRSGSGTLALAKAFNTPVLMNQDEINNREPEPLNTKYMAWVDHAKGLKMPEIQRKIVDLLGMDCDTFQSCVLIMQDRYGKFMEASKEDRMNVLASLLGLGIYDELEKLAKDKLTEVNRAIKLLKLDVEKLEGDVKAEEDLRTEGAQVEISLVCANDDLKAAREELAGYQAQLVAIEGYVREIEALERDVRQKTDSYTDKKNRKMDLENRVTETESFLQNEKNILDRCTELNSTRLEIAGMDGKLKMLEDKWQQCGKIQRDLNSAQMQRNSIEVRLDGIKRNLQDRERLEGLVEGNTIEQILEDYEGKAKQVQEIKSKLDAERSRLVLLDRDSYNAIAVKRNRLDTCIGQTEMLGNANCIDVEKASCRFLQAAKEAKANVDILEAEIKNMRVELSVSQEEGKKLLEGLENEIRAIDYLSGTHNELLQEVKAFRTAKDMLSKMAADSATADALSRQDMDLAEKNVSQEQELGLIEREIAALEKETGKHSELVARVKSLLQYESMKMELPKAKQFVESANEQIWALTADMKGYSEEIEKLQSRLVELQELTAGKIGLKMWTTGTENKIKTFESSISTLNQQIGTIKAKLEVIFEQKQLLAEKQLDLQQAAKQAAQLQVLSEAFSQDGIPYQIIRDIVPELEAAANEILGQMTGGKMRLEFVTEKVLKSNKAKEIATLEIIIISVEHGALPYMSHSGGEKVRSALADNFALAIIKALRVGLQLGMLFIDEPPFLDADGVEAYCAALETIHNKYPDLRILAISHDENMKSLFPQQIFIEMVDGISRVRRL